MDSDVAGWGAVVAFVLAAAMLVLRWVLARAATFIDEMAKQDYPSFGARLGDAVLWFGARRTPDPVAAFEEWIAHMSALRAETDRPCLPDAIWMFLTSWMTPYEAGADGPRVAGAPAAALDPSFSTGLMDQMFTLWIEPELVRRGRALDRAAIHSAVVVMAPHSAPRVLLDDEARWVAKLPTKRAIEAGEEVTDDDVDVDAITGLRPDGIESDAGWTGFVQAAGRQWISFDFRRNRGRAGALLDDAASALAASHSDQRFRLRRRSMRHLLVAANLAVAAQELLHADDPLDDPVQRATQFREFAKLGNVPLSHSRCLDRLQRLSAIKGALPSRLASGRTELRHLTATVADMIEVARVRVGD